MKSLIISISIFLSLTVQKCSSQEKENLKIKFVKKFIQDNKNDEPYFKDKELFFMGYEQGFEYKGYKVRFIDSETLSELVMNKKKMYVFSMSEPYVKEKKIKAYFTYLIASGGVNKERDVKYLDNMNAIYCMTYNCEKEEYIVEWCGETR
ncbi:hypothetical protein [uncultured Tenacibaculum sp.]|uniref:hypothetical protein n=1 Tax=uncultured Tenacibaculum sp. TaxID=174713 RepID=UPI0026018C63|nr:hypothetical protein [uncultured Tenacibaculum sp.]